MTFWDDSSDAQRQMTSWKADAVSPFRAALESAQEPFCCVLSVGQGRSHSDQGEGISVSLSLKEENDTLLWGRVIG